jgi:hypothetical protein
VPEKPQPPQAQREIVLEMTPEQLAEWKQQDSTKAVFRFLRLIREDLKELLAGAHSLDLQSVEATALQTARLVGEVSGLDHLLELRSQEPEEGN